MKLTRPSGPDKTPPSCRGDLRGPELQGPRPRLVQDYSDQGRGWMEEVTDPLALGVGHLTQQVQVKRCGTLGTELLPWARLRPWQGFSSSLPSPSSWGRAGMGATVSRGEGGSHINENPHPLQRSANPQGPLPHPFATWVCPAPLGEISPAFLNRKQGGGWKAPVRSVDSGIGMPGSKFWLYPFLTADLGYLI